MSIKNNRRWLAGLLGIACLPLPAQQNKLSIASPDPLPIKRGLTADEHFHVSVLPGFHVNSDKPRDEYLIPLKITFDNGVIEAVKVDYPKPEDIQVAGSTLSVFTGNFDIAARFKAGVQSQTGAATVTGKLHYQACNESMCFRPSTVEFSVPVQIQ